MTRLAGPLPAQLQAVAAHAVARIRQAYARALEVAPSADNRFTESARSAITPLDDERCQHVLALSPFVVDWAERCPRAFIAGTSGEFDVAQDADALTSELERILADVNEDSVLKTALRLWRARHQVGIIWRDLLGVNDLDSTTAELSTMAEVAVRGALAWCHARETQERGTPMGARSGQPQALTVIAMGKLGARELNLSSDIDLILAFPEVGETLVTPEQTSARACTNQAFFTRLAQRFAAALGEQTADGIVFRVDLRLRPFGESGALVANFDTLEEYYHEQGRDWERYALIKARPIAGDAAQGAALLARLRPFVYRRYLDFGAIESLREMKDLIARERRAPEFEADVKLGPGGIREVEFTAQVFQLIFGGRDARLQERRLRHVLPVLVQGAWMSAATVALLDDAYVFLRDCEHRLQAINDEQTQRLPATELDRLRLAVGMGYATWPAFLQALERHRAHVRNEFTRLIGRPTDDAAFAGLWPVQPDDAAQVLSAAGFGDPPPLLAAMDRLANSRGMRVGQEIARRRLDAFVPRLIAAAAATPDPDRGLAGGLQVAEAVLRRSAYLALLNENPKALQQLVRLCAASDWIVAHICARPALLDELLDSRSLYTVPDRQVIGAWLHQHMARLPGANLSVGDDLEVQLNGLREFKEAHELRVAACEVTGALPLMKVSDALTWCAEAVLEESLDLAWRLTTERYGAPKGHRDFLIVGYGKLGGLELGPQSDLDLLFFHDSSLDELTDGAQPIAASVFFARLSQRLLHILTTATTAGTLYDIDTRLRPSGRKGLMVTTLAAFEDYQRDEAWTYEHQALVRARPVAGSRHLGERFDDCRRRILAIRRDSDALRSEILSMRERMDAAVGQLGDETAAELKRGPGGIIDIEFIVQYLVLAHASRVPALMRHTDNVRILEAAAASGILDATTATLLTDAYLALRSAAHRIALGGAHLPPTELEGQRRAVRAAWSSIFGDAAPHSHAAPHGTPTPRAD